MGIDRGSGVGGGRVGIDKGRVGIDKVGGRRRRKGIDRGSGVGGRGWG